MCTTHYFYDFVTVKKWKLVQSNNENKKTLILNHMSLINKEVSEFKVQAYVNNGFKEVT